MKGGFDRSKSLQELERHDWGEPTFDSYLVTTCHRLRRKPLNQFSVEDLRIMIGQQISLSYLIPLAVERLEADPLAAGHCYAGDLLSMVLMVDEAFWISHPDSLERVRRVTARARDILLTLDDGECRAFRRTLEEAPPFLTGRK